MAMTKAEQSRRYRERHRAKPEYRRRRAALAALDRARHPKSPLETRAKRLRLGFGLTLEQYASMLAEQGGGCALCSRPPKNLPLHVDHCHRTGMIRGLLCHRCNRGLGYIQDADVLARAVDYVRRDTGRYIPKLPRRARVQRRQWVPSTPKARVGIPATEPAPMPLLDHLKKPRRG